MKSNLSGTDIATRRKEKEANLPIETLKNKLSYNPNTGIFTRNCVMPGSSIGSVCGTLKPSGYIVLCVDRTFFRAHRLAWFYYYGEWPIGDVDHINRNRSDNRISNLREASRSDNICNSSKRSDNKTGVRGVSFNPRSKNYTVKIEKSGCVFVQHGVKDLDKAKQIAEGFIKQLHGEFASIGA